MAKIGDPPIPTDAIWITRGPQGSVEISLRDWFAGQAAARLGWWARDDSDNEEEAKQADALNAKRAQSAYCIADAMLKAREGK